MDCHYVTKSTLNFYITWLQILLLDFIKKLCKVNEMNDLILSTVNWKIIVKYNTACVQTLTNKIYTVSQILITVTIHCINCSEF